LGNWAPKLLRRNPRAGAAAVESTKALRDAALVYRASNSCVILAACRVFRVLAARSGADGWCLLGTPCRTPAMGDFQQRASRRLRIASRHRNPYPAYARFGSKVPSDATRRSGYDEYAARADAGRPVRLLNNPLKESQRSYVARHPRRPSASSRPEQSGHQCLAGIAVTEMVASGTTVRSTPNRR
jgi:hypothetical protein